jgi:hypothetical protein
MELSLNELSMIEGLLSTYVIETNRLEIHYEIHLMLLEKIQHQIQMTEADNA